MANKCLTITRSNFDETVLQSTIPVLVDFWAPWCGPCRMVSPLIEEIADEYAGRAIVGKLNIDDHIELAQKYRVMSIPTVLLFKEGEAVERIVGAHPQNTYADLLIKHL